MTKINIKTLGLLLFSLFSTGAFAQLISSVPIFPHDNQSVIITFNSALGSAGLANYNGDIYAHTGVITNLSTSQSDWKYIKTNWGQNTAETKLHKIGPNKYTLNIGPTIRAYYGVPAGEKILRLAFVFRSDIAVGGSYLEGKTTAGNDIFIDVYDGNGININMNKPSSNYVFLNQNDSLALTANSINADSIFLYANEQLLKSAAGNQIQDTLIAHNFGQGWVKAVASNSTQTVSDSFYYYVRDSISILPLPSGIKEGINYIDSNTVTLCLFAPFKKYAFVIGDFNNWLPDTAYYMHLTPDSNHFWISIKGLTPRKQYIFQYFVDGKIKIGDPYAQKVSDPWNDKYISAATYPNMLSYPSGKTQGIATVLQTEQKPYRWKNNHFDAPKQSDLVVYELLVRDFTAKHTFQAIIDSLHYLKTLGINAIELMPINEFEGNDSWGYNPNYYFAVDKYYGPKDQLKSLIDTCHSQGIAIILDVVYNHSFGTSPYVMLWWDKQNHRPAANNPFYNAIPKHDFNVGFDFNHESSATRKYISRALTFWLEQYKVDGFRFDLSKGFTQHNTLGNVGAWGQYDASRIYILNRYADTIWSRNANAYVILEHFAVNSEEKELSRRGMMLWGNMNTPYAEAAMGYNNSSKSDFSWISYKKRGWDKAHVMGYMESHDEQRLMYKCSQWGNSEGTYNITEKATYLKRASLDALFFLTIPGPKMIWQFGELGYDISIDFNGRTAKKPILWNYFSDIDRHNTYLIYKALTHLRANEHNCFQTKDFTLNLSGKMKSIILRDTSLNAVVVGNFDVKQDSITVAFPHNGDWYDYLSGQKINITKQAFHFTLKAGEFHLLTDKKQQQPEYSIAPSKIITDTLNIQGTLKIFPNPNDGNFSLYINSQTEVTITIYDITGKEISRNKVNGKGKRIYSLGKGNIPLKAGIYILKMQDNNRTISKKFIVL